MQMASRRTIIIKICLFLHIFEVLLGIVLTVFSFLLQNAADVGLDETPSWLGIPCALFGLTGIIIIVLNKLKEELVFVLVFHGLVIGLCIIGLVLVAPKVNKWQPVARYFSTNACTQIVNRCNCTESLPTEVHKCTDLEGIHDLALIIAVIVALCLVDAVFAAYFDFVIITRYVPRDNVLQTSTSRRAGTHDEEQLVNSLRDIGHAGPLNTPNLTPRASDDIMSLILLNRRNKNDKDRIEQRRGTLIPGQGGYFDNNGYNYEIMKGDDENGDVSDQEKNYQEEDQEEKFDGMGSSASLPVERPAVEANKQANDQVKQSSIPNSVAGSKQSIRSRKDTLLRRLQSVQSYDEPNRIEDEQDDAILNEIENNSQRSSKARLQSSTRSIRTSPRINDEQYYTSNGLIGKSGEADRVMAEKLSSSVSLPQYTNRDLNRLSQTEYSMRSVSEANILGRKSNGRANTNIEASKRSQSESNVLEVTQNESVKEILNASMEDRQSMEDVTGNELDRMYVAPERKSGFSNKDLRGLPPLPLKEFKQGLSIQERTFSAPTLPLIYGKKDKFPNNESINRPGSSASQVLAKSKNEFSKEIRNDLIDIQIFSDHNEDAPLEDEDDTASLPDNRRKNSFDTNSTVIDMDDKGEEDSETSEDIGRKPRWHPPWQLKQEIIAHKDAVPVLAIEPRNRWFASGSSDRTIKIWDLNSGNCRLTVKAHKGGVRALAFGSSGHRFIYSAADDRQLICTDIEVNKVVSHYPDQSSVIYAMAMYRPADLLVTCGRDKYVKIWDTREKKCVKTMKGHMNTTSSVAIVQNSGQIVSGSHDSTMRIWDIGEGRCTQILTGHDKSVRSIVVHPEEPIISSASTERIIHWSMPDGENIKEITPTDISINCISVNPQGALVAAGSNGVIHLWDWKSGHKFQKIHRTSVYESQEIPICVFSVAFDKSGSRLLVSDASNIIKVYGEAYTRVRRRHGNAEEKNKGKRKESQLPSPDYAVI